MKSIKLSCLCSYCLPVGCCQQGEEEVARLRSQVALLSSALMACQTNTAQWQAKFEASAKWLQARAVEAHGMCEVVGEEQRARWLVMSNVRGGW